jgi:group I intron endonuclease
MTCTIYVIKNTVNNKVYVGQTWCVPIKRFSLHLRDKSGSCLKLFRALNKYDRKNFNMIPLVYCERQDEADVLESFFIKLYNSIANGYNIREGGSGGKLSEETKKKISIGNKGKIVSEKTRKLLRVINTGKILSKEHCKKLSKVLLGNTRRRGKVASPETKQRMSIAHIGNQNRLGIPHSPEDRDKISKAVRLFVDAGRGRAKINYDIADQIKNDYLIIKSHRKLAKKYGVAKSTIGRVIRNEIWSKK